METQIAQLKAELARAQPIPAQTLGVRERESMLKLIIGMAIAGYRYDARAKRNESVRDITGDLAKCRVPLSDDTVRKYLSEGAELIPPMETHER